MISTALEKVFYHYTRINPELLEIVRSRFFETPYIAKCYELDIGFFKKFSKVPNSHQMKELVRAEGLQEEISDDAIEILFDINLGEYERQWVEENAEAWIEWKNLDTSLFDAIRYLKTTNVTTENIQEVVQTVKTLINDRNSLDFKFELGLDFFDPESHIQPLYDTFSTGWNFMDQCMSGGYSVKSLVCIAGPAKIGKSIFLANLSTNAIRLGYNTALISCEMRDRKFIKRCGANILNIPMSQYDDWSRNRQEELRRKLNGLATNWGINPGKFIIREFPTSTLTVPQLEAYLRRAEDVTSVKFKLVVVDYVNILNNYRNPNTENTYMKVKQLCEDLRAMAQRNEWCVLTATQLNRSGVNNSDVTMTNVAESFGLVQTVDALFGIMQDPMERVAGEYRLKALALRDGDGMNMTKKYDIDYNYMRIVENHAEATDTTDELFST